MRKFVAFSPLPNVKILLFISSLTHIVQPVTIKGTSDAVRPALCHAPAREGYIPNAFAHSLNTHKSQTIGIICPVIADANHAYPVSELTKLLRAAHLETLLINTDSNPESKRPYFASLINRQVDAAIVIGCNCSAQERRDFAFAAAHFPVFVVNGVVPGRNIYCTVCDEKKAAHQAVLRLAGAGLRRILYLYDSQTYSGVQKLEGYCQGMRELPGGEPLCVQIRCDGPSYPRTIEVVSELLDRTPFDAILTADDSLAIGAAKALAAAGRPPVPMIGFNNTILSRCVTPELSSIDNRIKQQCLLTVQTLLSVLRGEPAAACVTLDAELIRRETGP